MEKKIIDFINILRKNDINISVSETLDAINAAAILTLNDREIFKNALRSALVKDSLKIKSFDGIFNIYFINLKEILDKSYTNISQKINLNNYNKLESILNDLSDELSPLVKLIIKGNVYDIQILLREAFSDPNTPLLNNILQIALYSNQILAKLGFSGLKEDLILLKERLLNEGFNEDEVWAIIEGIEENIKALKNAVKSLVEMELQKQKFNFMKKFREDFLLEKSFFSLSNEEIEQMDDVIRHLVEKLRNRISIRKKKEKRGKFDIKGTLRKNLETGGVPFKLAFKNRKIKKAKIIALCDISDSVRNAARLMLHFIYSLQEQFSKIRTFVFVSELGETTRLFERNPIEDAIEKTYKGGVINVYSHSDYGNALHTFYKNYLNSVDKNTSIIILGDGRNNYNYPNDWVLKHLKSRAKNIIWFNPENPLTWRFGDSEMWRYSKYCDVVEETRNLKQLSRVIDKLLL